MKNMPSVMREIPNGAKLPNPGKRMQNQPASANGPDVDSSAVVPMSPVAFHRLFQDSLRVHEQAGIRSASASADGQDQGDTAGKTQLGTQDSEKGLQPLVSTKSRSGKGRLMPAPGVKGKTGKGISADGPLSASPNVAISSQNIPVVDNNQECAPLAPQETTERHVRLHNQGNVRRQLQNGSGKTHDHLRSDRRQSGEYSTAPGEWGVPSADAPLLAALGEGSGKNTGTEPGVMISPLLNPSAVESVNAAQPSLGSGNGSAVPSLGRQLNASVKMHDQIRAGHRFTGEYAAYKEERGASIRNAAGAEADGAARKGLPDDAGDVTPMDHGVDMRDVGERTRQANDSPLRSSLREELGKGAQAATGEKTSPLSTATAFPGADAARTLAGSDDEKGGLSAGLLHKTSGKMDSHVRSGRRPAGDDPAVYGGKGGPDASEASVAIEGKGKVVPADDADGLARGVRRAENSHAEETTGRSDDAPPPRLKENAREHLQRAVAGGKTSLLSAAATVPAADAGPVSNGSNNERNILSAGLLSNVSGKMHNPVRSGRRQTGEHSDAPEAKGGSHKNGPVLEAEGMKKSVPADDVSDLDRGIHGLEVPHGEQNEGRPDGASPHSLLRENQGDLLRRTVVGDEMSLISTASTVPVVDAASISVGSDRGEGILSPGRQAMLMTEVIDAARPLVQQDGGRVRISLSPPSLGDLDIDVRVKKDGVELFVVANNSDVQQTLCSHADQLRKALSEQGLNMDRFQVVVGERSDGQQGRDPRQDGMSNGHREAWSERGYLPEFDGNTANDEMRNRALSSSHPSVGMINLFI